MLEGTLRDKKIDAVMHFAAFSLVGESVANPAKYYQNNLVASFAAGIDARTAGVTRIVLSSTTATYGAPRSFHRRDTPQRPINPYGFTKLVVEHA